MSNAVSGSLALAALAAALVGCNSPQASGAKGAAADSARTAVVPPAEISERVHAYSGLPASAVTYLADETGYRATYVSDHRHVTLQLAADGTLKRVQETVEFVPYVPSEANQRIEAATSAAEDFAEIVIDQDPGWGIGVARLKARVAALHGLVPEENFKAIDAAREQVDAALAGGDPRLAARCALDLYDRLQEANDFHGAPVPREVALLDGTGFRAELGLSAASPDWTELKRTADSAQQHWQTLRPQVADPNLDAVVEGIVTSVVAGSQAKNVEQTRAATSELLAVVDLLEQYFEEQYKRR